MPFISTNIQDLLVFEPKLFGDARGHFFEAYNAETFAASGVDTVFVQDNQSYSKKGVIRGLHYQLNPAAQVKLVRVLRGVILDVAVDIRTGSPTFGQHFAIELSDENKLQLYIPAGFAHGFSVLSDEAVVMYKCSSLYNKEAEAGIRYDDPELGIDWKMDASQAIVSEKDLILPSFRECRNNFTI